MTEQDMVIKGYRIPKGVALMFAPIPLHLSPFNFTHPNKFWPDRWTTDVVADWDPKRSGQVLLVYVFAFVYDYVCACV